MSASSTSLWVANRTVRVSIVPARMPSASSRSSRSLGRRSAIAQTMLVSTASGATAARQPVGDRLGEPARAAVVVGEPVDHRLERDEPGRRDHPRLAHAAAEALPVHARLAGSCRAGPHSTDPTGAPRPFDTQNITAVAGATSSPRRHAERDRRVPDARPVAVERDAVRHRRRRRRPRSPRCATAARTSACACSRSRSARPPASGGRRPGPSRRARRRRGARRRRRTGAAARPSSTPPRRASYRNTCARAAHSTSVPGRASTRSASWFAIVPDGTYSAASFPRSSAARSWNRLTVGSSP